MNWLKVAFIAALVAPESRQKRPPTPPPPPTENRRASTIPYDDLPTPPPEDAHGRERTIPYEDVSGHLTLTTGANPSFGFPVFDATWKQDPEEAIVYTEGFLRKYHKHSDLAMQRLRHLRSPCEMGHYDEPSPFNDMVARLCVDGIISCSAEIFVEPACVSPSRVSSFRFLPLVT